MAGTFHYGGTRFLLGEMPGAYAIWERAAPDGPPVIAFPGDGSGWSDAWRHFSHWEPAPQPIGIPQQSATPSTADAYIAPAHPWGFQGSAAGGSGTGFGAVHTYDARTGIGVATTGGTAAGRPTWQFPASASGRGPRKALAFVAAGVAVVLIAGGIAVGLGHSNTAANGRSLILAAYSKTESSSTAQLLVSGTMNVSTKGISVNLDVAGTGQVDFSNHAESVDMSISVPGGNSSMQQTTSEIVSGGTSYLRDDSNSLPTGKSWLSVTPRDLSAIAAQSGGSGDSACSNYVSSLVGGSASQDPSSTGGSIDPSALLNNLKMISGNVTDSGHGSVNGTSAEHYHADIDMMDAITKEVGTACADQWRSIMSTSGISSWKMPIDIWIADSGIIVRETATLDMNIDSKNSGGGTVHGNFTVDFSDYGAPVTIAPPPASQVETLTHYVAQSQPGGTSQSA